MISYVKGKLAEVNDSGIVVETGGMGFEIKVPLTVLSELPCIGEEVKIHTYFRVSEDAMTLYGFTSSNDKSMFEQLIGVSGIGPKGALAILGIFKPDDLRMAIVSGDAAAIAKAPGIGAKTAQRIIIDLKDKISNDDLLGKNDVGGRLVGNADSGVASQTIEALITLGYSASEAARAVRNVEITDDMDVEDVLKAALRRF